MSDLLNQASLVMVPSGYKEDIVYSVVPSDGSGDLSFTRASNGTRINSAGLVEVVPWNLLTYSNDFSSSWALIEASKSTGVTDPIGNANAIKLKYTTATSGHYITQGISLTGSNAHSVYAKAGELQFLQIASAQSINEYANFNLSTGAVGTYGSYASNVQIENVGNGWYRCSVVFTNGTNGIYLAIVQSASSDWFGISTYAGANSTNGLYLYGGQVNAGTLKPYFPTTDRLNVPRLTYQNGGGGCPSLLLEKQSTNIALYSEDAIQWATGSTVGSITITANQTTSPDGTQNADQIQIPAVASPGDFAITYYQFTASATDYSGTIYLKGNSGGEVVYIMYTPNGVNYTSVACTLTTEWQRFNITSNLSAGTQYFQIGVDRRDSAQTAKNAQTIYVWGRQLEASSYATSYIPTTSSSATRVADECSKTGISSLIGQTEGTIFVDIVMKNDLSSVNRVVSITESNWLSGGSIRVDIQIASISVDFVNGNISIGALGYITSFTPNTRYKIAVAYKTNDCALYMNGTQLSTITSIGTMPTCSELYLNELGGGFGGPWRPTEFNQVALFKTRLTNAELASLTTI